MPRTQAQVILRTTDAVPENFLTNTYAIDFDSNPTSDQLLMDAITVLYSTLSASIFSAHIAQNGHMVKLVDIDGPAPQYPYLEETFDLTTAPAGATLPTEVAIVGSFQGARTAGQYQARRRGRVYFGGIREIENNAGRPSVAAVTGIATALSAFGLDVNAIADTTWCVWSRVDDAFVPITDGWVDNAFDTQRRRGVATTSRTTWFV